MEYYCRRRLFHPPIKMMLQLKCFAVKCSEALREKNIHLFQQSGFIFMSFLLKRSVLRVVGVFGGWVYFKVVLKYLWLRYLNCVHCASRGRQRYFIILPIVPSGDVQLPGWSKSYFRCMMRLIIIINARLWEFSPDKNINALMLWGSKDGKT